MNYLDNSLISLLCPHGSDIFWEADSLQAEEETKAYAAPGICSERHHISNPEALTPGPRVKTDLGDCLGMCPHGSQISPWDTDILARQGSWRRGTIGGLKCHPWVPWWF